MRLATSGNTRKRMDLRIRHTSGSLRSVGKVELVCSERRNRPDGRRKYLACNDLRATARQIVTDRKSTRLNSSHLVISYAVFCLKKKKKKEAAIQFSRV